MVCNNISIQINTNGEGHQPHPTLKQKKIMSNVSNRINLDVIMNDIKVEIEEANISFYPLTIEKGESYVRLSDFKFDMISTVFIQFLNRFCSERDLNWFVNLESESVIIG